VIVAVAAQAEAASDYPSGPAFGVQFHGMWSKYSAAQRTDVLTKLKAAGTQWIRLDLGWAMLQPSGAGSFDMGWGVPFTDSVIDEIHADGFHLLVTFWRTPGWANANAGETTLPTNPADYANAIKWAAGRYAGKVNAWEVWNEPNEPYSMTGTDPAKYAALLRAAYPAVHAGDPSAQVVFGGPSENDAPWIAKAYAAGIHGSFDVMATHPYMGPSDAAPETADDGTIYKLTHVTAVHNLMTQYGDGDKPIWFTEFGWSSHSNTSGMANWELGVTPQTQGDYLVRTLKLLKASYPYVTNAFWYEASDQNTGTTSNIDNYGLLTSSFVPKPAYAAVQTYLASLATTTTTTTTTTTSPSPTPTDTATASPTPTPTDTATASPSPTPTDTATSSPTPTPVHVITHGPKRTAYGQSVTMTAQLTTSDGAPLAGAPVTVSTATTTGASAHVVESPVSDANGVVRVTLRPTSSAQVRFSFAGSPAAAPAAASMRIAVASKVSAHLNLTRVRHGLTVRLSGRVTPGWRRFLVYREVWLRGAWRVAAVTRTAANGVYTFKIQPRTAAHLTFRIVVAARGQLGKSTSTLQHLTVV
jgi:polysaccharide biosynthesis protein PslG